MAQVLSEFRLEIDRIDEKIVRLLDNRMRIVSKIAETKSSRSITVRDREREKELLAKVTGYNHDVISSEDLTIIFKIIMRCSRSFQEDITGERR